MNRSQHERLAGIVATLPVPAPWDLQVFLQALGEQRDRPILLHPIAGSRTTDTPTGLWLPTFEADHIFYEHQTSKPHQDHIVCHEVGHMVLRHQPDPANPGHYLRRKVFQHLDTELVDLVRARTSYQLVEEQEAETVATLILDKNKNSRSAANLCGTPAAAWDSLLGFDS